MMHGIPRVHIQGEQYIYQVDKLLNELEPGGPRGKVQLGFTLPLHVFNFFKEVDDGWVYDDTYIKPILDLCKFTKRLDYIRCTGVGLVIE